MNSLTRRDWLTQTAAATLAATVPVSLLPAEENPSKGFTFSFGTYGMKDLKTEDAIKSVAAIGYDAIELTVRSGWDSAAEKLTPSRRKELRKLLSDEGLILTSMMEHLIPSTSDQTEQQTLDRLKVVAELGHDLSPDAPPLIQTVLGGGKWDTQKHLFLHRLKRWQRVGEESKTVIAIKPHRGGAMSRPKEAAWLIKQLGNSKWLKMVYDYSHYAFRNMTIAETVLEAGSHIAHVAIKDTVVNNGRASFVLPGASGNIDYATLFKELAASGYAGDICCEVSGQVWNKPDYQSKAAAETCYKNIDPVLEKLKLRRSKG